MKVSIVKTAARYAAAPFHPSERYPEYPYPAEAVSSLENPVYAAVRRALYLLGLDAENYGTPAWNPLGKLIREDSRVVIKPNFVNHYNPLSDERAYFDALVTQGAVMRPIMDYLLIAARGRLTLTFADLPIQNADFEALCQKTGLDRVIEFALQRTHGRASIELLDLRTFRLVTERSGAVLGRVELPGDPRGYVVVDLGEDSSLVPLQKDAGLFRAPDYDGKSTTRMHSDGRHQYVLPRTILMSDLFMNVPKLKVHRKVGVTLCLKNLVGIIGDKSCLPHWRAGSSKNHGDEFPVSTVVHLLRSRYDFDLRQMGKFVWSAVHPIGRMISRLDEKAHSRETLAHIINGDWYGNDTAWRMVHDLNRIILHADAQGMLHDEAQRHYMAVIDGIIGGEAEGPLKPRPVPSGLIVAGADPLALDVCCARLMGLDWEKIPQLSQYDPTRRYAFSEFDGDPKRVEVISLDRAYCQSLAALPPLQRFEPASGWKGHIELAPFEDIPQKGLAPSQRPL